MISLSLHLISSDVSGTKTWGSSARAGDILVNVVTEGWMSQDTQIESDLICCLG